MSTDDLMSDLPAWLDGELPPERAAAVEAAMVRDPALRNRAEELKALDRLLALHPEAAVDAGLAGRVALAAGQDRSAPLLFRRRFVRAAALVAAAAGIVAAIVNWWPQTGSGGEETAVPLVQYGVFAASPSPSADAQDLHEAVREIESIGEIYVPLG